MKYDAGENGGVGRVGNAIIASAIAATGWRIVLGGDVREARGWFQSFLIFFFAAVIADNDGAAPTVGRRSR
jgi:hypothetical protein